MKKRIKCVTHKIDAFNRKSVSFYPQYRWCFIWFDFKDENGMPKRFIAKNKAILFLDNYINDYRSFIHEPLGIINIEYQPYTERYINE